MKKRNSHAGIMASTPAGHLFISFILLFIVACSKSIKEETVAVPAEGAPLANKPAPPPPPTPANPAFVFNADTSVRIKGTTHAYQGIFVMDADGSHRKLLHHDFLVSGNSWSNGTVRQPKWSGNGQQICYVGRVQSGSTPLIRPLSGFQSLYKLNVTLVNGVPTASNLVKLLDGAAHAVDYREPAWSSSNNEIVLIGTDPVVTDRLLVVPATGGSATLLVPATTNHRLSSPCFSPDGSQIAFIRRNSVSGEKWINIIDRNTSALLYNISLDPAYAWFDLDWSRTAGSTLLTFRNSIPNSGNQGSVFTLDFSVTSTPTAVSTNGGNTTWSPDDTKIAFVNSTNGIGVKVLTLATNTITTISTLQASALNWRRSALPF